MPMLSMAPAAARWLRVSAAVAIAVPLRANSSDTRPAP
jgi:hypothetical protein